MRFDQQKPASFRTLRLGALAFALSAYGSGVSAFGQAVTPPGQGPQVQTPPALWLQGQPDIVHDYHDPDYAGSEHEPQRFVNNYRKAGGEIDLLYVDNAKKQGAGSFAPAAAFFHRYITG